MKTSSWEKQLGLALPLQLAVVQSMPVLTASSKGMFSPHSRLISLITSTPLMTETPNNEINPMIADTLKCIPRRYRKRIPPTVR
jgi:hypothetical protein